MDLKIGVFYFLSFFYSYRLLHLLQLWILSFFSKLSWFHYYYFIICLILCIWRILYNRINFTVLLTFRLTVLTCQTKVEIYDVRGTVDEILYIIQLKGCSSRIRISSRQIVTGGRLKRMRPKIRYWYETRKWTLQKEIRGTDWFKTGNRVPGSFSVPTLNHKDIRWYELWCHLWVIYQQLNYFLFICYYRL